MVQLDSPNTKDIDVFRITVDSCKLTQILNTQFLPNRHPSYYFVVAVDIGSI